MVKRSFAGSLAAPSRAGKRLAGDAYVASDAYVPVDTPLPFEYRGQKGGLQLFGQARQSPTTLVRARMETRHLFAIPGGVRALSVPGQQLPVNPQGWRHQTTWGKALADRWIFYSNSDKMGDFFDDLKRAAALDGLRSVVDVTSVGLTLTPLVVEIDTLVLSQGKATAWLLTAKIHELLETLPVPERKGYGTIDPAAHPPLALALASCEVCHHALEFPVALCEGCVTPHHLDCWRYIQHCSTYGCHRPSYVLIQDLAELEAHLGGSQPRLPSL